MNPITKEFKFGDQLVKIETGEIARQADGAVSSWYRWHDSI